MTSRHLTSLASATSALAAADHLECYCLPASPSGAFLDDASPF